MARRWGNNDPRREKIEGLLAVSLMRGARLRQSILKRAFEGKLVPQDQIERLRT